MALDVTLYLSFKKLIQLHRSNKERFLVKFTSQYIWKKVDEAFTDKLKL